MWDNTRAGKRSVVFGKYAYRQVLRVASWTWLPADQYRSTYTASPAEHLPGNLMVLKPAITAIAFCGLIDYAASALANMHATMNPDGTLL